jgi:hypothetical protein
MATSGTKTFELNVTDYIEEAFERCGLEVRTGYDVQTAKRSLNLMLAEWANRGINQWTIEQTTQALTKGTSSYALGASTIDVLSVIVRRDNTDYGLNRVSRDDYLNIPNKSTEARVSQFFVDRQIDPLLKVWPAPDNSTDVLIFDRLVRMDDSGTSTATLDLPFRFYPCLAAGLSYYLAIKRAPDRIQLLKAVYEEEIDRAMTEDRDRASFNVQPSLDYYRIN